MDSELSSVRQNLFAINHWNVPEFSFGIESDQIIPLEKVIIIITGFCIFYFEALWNLNLLYSMDNNLSYILEVLFNVQNNSFDEL
mgnify:CR=1 FL=1